jgi:hypothetical protein
MNIDERLERLAERHEALAQSIELLTHDISELRASAEAAATAATAGFAAAKERHEANWERHDALAHSVELLVAEGKQTGERVRHLAIIAEQNEVRAGHMMENMNRLGRILEIHDARIDQNAQRLERLEG